MPAETRVVREILIQALGLLDPVERAAFLATACGNDAELRRRVESLLHASETPDDATADAPMLAGTAPHDPAALPRTVAHEAGPDIGTIIAGRYRLIEEIGEGGMGTVWLAQQTEPVKRLVAIKLIKAGMDSRAVLARFEAERQALAMMDHPNIAKVLDGGVTHDGRPYFVMELVKGVPITKYCDDHKLTPRERLELFVPVCHAVQHAHQKGVIHRDLKPSNILVALYDDRPMPKVIDFGVAKAAGATLTDLTLVTGFGAVVGTPEYMSPEQAELNQLDIDTRSDVYALGVVLYELLTGSTPFSRKQLEKAGLVEILRMIREQDPPKPSTKLSTAEALPSLAANRGTEPRKLTGLIRGELDWIVMKALEKDRNRRYETANGFAADVLRYLAGEAVLAVPPAAGYRLRKFVRRHKARVVALTIVLLALAGGTIGTTFGLVEARRQRDEAEAARRDEATERAAALAERDQKELARAAEAEQRQKADAERDAKGRVVVRADGLRLAAEASAMVRGDPGLALQLAAEGVRRFPHHLTFAAFYSAVAECREERTLSAGADVRLARFSPDGRRVLVARGSATEAGTISIHDIETGQQITSWHGYGMPVGAVDWSPDGRRVAVAVEGYAHVRYTDKREPVTAVYTDQAVYVLDANTGKDVLHLRRHKQRVATVRFSPNGSQILTASWDGTARLWDADTGKELHNLDAHITSLLLAKFSRDGKRVLTLSSGFVLESSNDKVWLDATKSSKPGAVDPGPSDRPSARSSPGSQHASMSAGDTKQARIWDVETGKVVTAFSKKRMGLTFGTIGDPTAGTFSPDGTRVAVAFSKNLAAIWDAADGTEKLVLEGHDGPVNDVVFSPDGRQLATASADKTARVWDATTGKETIRLRGHQGPVLSVQFTPDSRRVLTTSDDRTARLWDATTGDEVASFRGHSGPVRHAVFDPKATKIVTAGDTTARVWTTGSPPEAARVILAHKAPLTALAFSPDGAKLLTASEDETAQLVDPTTGQRGTTFGTGMVLGAVRDAAFSADGRSVVTASETTHGTLKGKVVNLSALHVWDAESGAERYQFREHEFGAVYAAFSPDSGRVVSVGDGWRRAKGGSVSGSKGSNSDAGLVRVWDLPTQRLLYTVPEHVRAGSRPQFSRDGRSLLTLPKTGPAALLDALSGRPLRTFPPAGDEPDVVALSPDGRRVLTTEGRGPTRTTLWDADTGAKVAELGLASKAVSATFFSSDSRRFVTLTDRTAQVWDAVTGKALATLVGHEAPIVATDIAPDGSRLLTGSADHTAALWDATTGELLAVYMGHPGPVKYVAFSSTGRHLATGSTDGVVRMWAPDPVPEAIRRAPRGLTQAERHRFELVTDPIAAQPKAGN